MCDAMQTCGVTLQEERGLAIAGSNATPASVSSDIREMNEAKVANILAYLQDSTHSTPSLATCGDDTDGGRRLCHSVCASDGDERQHTRTHLTASALRRRTERGEATARRTSDANSRPGGDEGGCSQSWLSSGMELAQHTYLGIKRKIDALRVANEELLRDNSELQSRIARWQRDEAQRKEEMRASVRQEVAELRQELTRYRRQASEQQKTFATAKAELERSADELSRQLRSEAAQREEERRKLEAAHAAAIAALKTRWQAQEKAARDKWKLAEAKRIKETTLQSLEPDIVLLLNRHKAEKARLREEYCNELRQRDELIAAKDASVEELKARLQRDAEATLAREQKSFQDRLREETEQVRRQLDEERHSERARRAQMESFFAEQKQALEREVARLGQELLELRRKQTTEQASFHDAVASEVARVTGRSSEVVEQLKERLMREFATRESEAAARNEKYLRTKEDELRRQCALERDAAIAKVVQRLEQEHVSALTAAQSNDGLLRERHAQLCRDNERLKVEAELLRSQLAAAAVTVQENEKELQALREAADLSDKRVQSIEDRIRSQYGAKLTILDNEWHAKLNELEARHVNDMCEVQQRAEATARELRLVGGRHEVELKTLEQQHHAELSQINERMLVAMTRKDNQIQTQAEQLLTLREAIAVRDRELEKHRTLIE